MVSKNRCMGLMSSYRGAVVQLRRPMSQATEVSVDRWSSYASDLFNRLYCSKVCSTVLKLMKRTLQELWNMASGLQSIHAMQYLNNEISLI